jgi:hypothetical protein
VHVHAVLERFLLRCQAAVAQVRLLVARGRHPDVEVALVRSLVHRRRVWLVKARLDERLSCLAGDHWLQFWGGEGVDMAGLGGH